MTMPTARELLEQAEALMRRDRTIAMIEPGSAELPGEPATSARGRSRTAIAAEPRTTLAEPDDIPLLTDAVPDFDPSAESPELTEGGEPSIWNDADEDRSIIGAEPDLLAPFPRDAEARMTAAAVDTEAAPSTTPAPSAIDAPVEATARPGPDLDSELVAALGSPLAPVPEAPPALDPVALAAHAAPESASFGLPARILDDAPAPVLGVDLEPPSVAEAAVPAVAGAPSSRESDDARWDALAEEIRMQVLQRIDIFTDTGLKEQLNRRLQPIVDRASADLVAAINQHVGQLLREYVAEAIEREIEKWRHEKH
jgi:hypothetical protein